MFERSSSKKVLWFVLLTSFVMFVVAFMGEPVKAGSAVVPRTRGLEIADGCPITYLSTDGTTKSVEVTTSITDCAEGWSWDASTATLTLAGVDITGSEGGISTGIYLDLANAPNVTIMVQRGTVNKIKLTYGAASCIGVLPSISTLTIKGSGTLMAEGKHYATISAKCAVVIEDATLNIKNENGDAALYSDKGVTINSGTHTFNGGIYSEIITINGGTVTATAATEPLPGRWMDLNERALLTAPILNNDIIQTSDPATTGWDKMSVTYGSSHVHTYATEWTTDAEYHWHAATCGHTDSRSEEAVHVPSADGMKCTVCGLKLKEEEIVDVFDDGLYTYKVTSDKTVKVTGFVKGKSTSKVSIGKTKTFKGKTYSITAIADKAFYKNTKIKQVNLSNNLVTIGKRAFYECANMTEAIIGDKVTKISDHAFYRCAKLKTVTIGKSVKEIGNHVFCNNKKMSSITIKSTKLTKVGKHVLYDCSNLKIKVPSSKVADYKKLFTKSGQKGNVTITK